MPRRKAPNACRVLQQLFSRNARLAIRPSAHQLGLPSDRLHPSARPIAAEVTGLPLGKKQRKSNTVANQTAAPMTRIIARTPISLMIEASGWRNHQWSDGDRQR